MPDIKRKKIYTNIYRNIFKNLNKKISESLGEKFGLKFCNLSQCIIANVAKSDNKHFTTPHPYHIPFRYLIPTYFV